MDRASVYPRAPPTANLLTRNQECAVQHQDNGLPFNYQVTVGHLEAVHEAVTSEVAARRCSGSESAIGRHDLTIQVLLPNADAKRHVRLRARLCAQPKEAIMKVPAILQGEARTRFLQGIAFGAVAAISIGFIWGGWVTAGTARTMSATAESSGRMSILVPMCVAQFTAADGAIAKFKTASSYSRDDVISEFVKTVASTSMDYSFARACAAGVEAELARTATKS